jgi:predicted deacetylase
VCDLEEARINCKTFHEPRWLVSRGASGVLRCENRAVQFARTTSSVTFPLNFSLSSGPALNGKAD